MPAERDKVEAVDGGDAYRAADINGLLAEVCGGVVAAAF